MPIRQQDVVCAFILPQQRKPQSENTEEEFKVLCAQRPDDTEYFPSLYEFAGGKVDEGESHHDALVREVREEMDVRIEVTQREPAFSFSHPVKEDKKRGGQVVFRLFFYWARLLPNADGSDAQPKALASQQVVWLTPGEMRQRQFCSGDEDIIEALAAGTLRPDVTPN